MAEAIGLISGLLGIVSFLQSNFPAKHDKGATVQIKGGLGDSTSNLGGNIDNTWAYDYNNALIGSGGGGKVAQGGILELTIDQKVPGIESDYIAISNTDIGTCIAWITVKQFDGLSSGAWTGDIGYNCGLLWYAEDYRPHCAWLDSNHDDNGKTGSIKFRVSAYGDHANETLANDHACDATIFQYDNGNVDGKPSGKRALTAPARYPWMEDVLIHSNITQHDGEHMCGHPMSFGPDFIDSQGNYCDMGSKTLMKICQSDSEDKCVHLDHDEKTVSKRSFGVKRTDQVIHKTFKNIEYWTE